MYPPEALTKDEPLFWSTGKGTDVWAMFCAAAKGDLATIQSLLDKDPSLIRSEYDYRTPISFAVRENQPSVVAYLLERGSTPINSGTRDTLLQIARDRGYTDIAYMLENAITGNKGTPQGNEIAAAIRSRDLATVKSLLDASPELIHARDDNTNQPIHWATMTRQPDIIDEVLARGADINAIRADGARPLQLCNGDYGYRGWRDVPKDTVATPRDIFNHLLQRGAYLDIYMAALTGNIERVKELLDQDPAIVNRIAECRTGYPGSGYAIYNAAVNGHLEIVKLLLERGADPGIAEPGNAPQGKALYEAVAHKHIDIARLLLEHGAFPNPEVESSADALSRALWNDDKPMIQLLCSYGATRKVHLLAYGGDVLMGAAVFAANPELANDVYALECATSEGHEAFARLMLRYQPQLAKQIAIGVKSQGPQDVQADHTLINFLFEQGMDAKFKNWLGVTPLHVYATRGDIENVTIFLQHGADIDAVEEEFYTTPLGFAAKNNQHDMVDFLLKQGANPNKAGAPWSTPLAWATRRGHTAIISLLQQYNAHE